LAHLRVSLNLSLLTFKSNFVLALAQHSTEEDN
jgi:hypothetical protein